MGFEQPDLRMEARQRLLSAYTEVEADQVLSEVSDEAVEALKEVRTSTNPVKRRQYLNAWLKEWKGKE